jgi:hypothetical protein
MPINLKGEGALIMNLNVHIGSTNLGGAKIFRQSVRIEQKPAINENKRISATFEQKQVSEMEKSRKSAFIMPDKEQVISRRLQAIGNKLMSGKKLSHEDMEFLREHDPETYKKAVKIEQEREAFRRALENCKTKQEVQQTLSSKAAQLQTEAQAASKASGGKKGGDAEAFVAMKFAAILNEFIGFMKSEEYVDIPNEYELYDENGKREYGEIDENNEYGESEKDEESGEKEENAEKGEKIKFKKTALRQNEGIMFETYKSNGIKTFKSEHVSSVLLGFV